MLESSAKLSPEFHRHHSDLIWHIGGPAEAIFSAADCAAEALTRRAYSTILCLDPGHVSRRLFSSVPDTYPVGASKVLAPSLWRERVIDRAETFMAASATEIAAAYPDPETVASLGGRCLVNCPIPGPDGRPIGLFNVAGHQVFSSLECTMLALIAAILGPAVATAVHD